MSTWPYNKETWFSLPLHLRQRWWRETHYSQIPPTCELLADVIEALLHGAMKLTEGERSENENDVTEDNKN